MNNFSCELFLNFIGPAYEVKDLRSNFIANCVFNNFLYLHYVEHCYSLCHTKDIFVTKDFGNIVDKSRCFRCWGWLVCSPNLHFTSGQLLTREQHYLSHLSYVPRLYSVICFSSVPECGSCKCRQVLSCSLHIRYQQIVTYKRDFASVISAWVSCAFVFALALLILHDTQTLITNIARGIGLEL